MTKIAEDNLQDDNNILTFNQPKPKFELLPGGKPPENMLWLKDIPEGYGVIVRAKNPGPNAPKFLAAFFQVMGHLGTCSRLFEGNSRTTFWVHSDDYSRAHECLEVIPITYPEETEEQGNGNSDQSTGPERSDDAPLPEGIS